MNAGITGTDMREVVGHSPIQTHSGPRHPARPAGRHAGLAALAQPLQLRPEQPGQPHGPERAVQQPGDERPPTAVLVLGPDGPVADQLPGPRPGELLLRLRRGGDNCLPCAGRTEQGSLPHWRERDTIDHRADMLFINIDQEGRAMEFLTRRQGQANGEQAYLLTFRVNASFVDLLRSTAVPQSAGGLFPDCPQVVDPQYPDQFGVPASLFDELLRNVVPGSVRTVRQ